MTKNDSRRAVISRILLGLVITFLVIYFVSIITGYSPFYNMSAEKNALASINKDVVKIDDLIEQRYEELREVKESITDVSSHEAISETLRGYIGSEHFGDLRFFSNGKIFDANGLEVMGEVEQILAFNGLNRRAFSGEYIDTFLGKSCIAFYIPVTGSPHITGLVSIVEARNFIDLASVLTDTTQAISLITDGGVNLCDEVQADSALTVGNNFYNFIERLTQNKEASQEVSLLVANYKSATASATNLRISGEKYVVAVKPIAKVENKLFAISLSKSKDLMAIEMEYLHHIISLLVISILSLFVSIIYAWLYHKNSKKKIRYANYTYQNLECPNIEQFKLDIANTLPNAPISLKKYSVVTFKIRRFITIGKVLEEPDVNEILRHAAKIFAGVCAYDETYAYLGNGVFVMLLRYEGDQAFAKRLNMIRAISAKNPFALSKGITLRYRIGVCHAFGGTRSSAMEMVDNALTACKIAEERTTAPFIIYDLSINQQVERGERIESMMEDGLKNGDFKLFLQPKYNVKYDRIDSAEALVRWFDRERADYIFPGEFISLFETNGFIVQLDHYIYLEVLKYFKNAVERGEKVVPVSVNVSRVTVAAPDFLDFYIDNKKKYGVGDDFIMLEVTESFALDTESNMAQIVEKLHKNGIKCSLDDFGAGFSSFNALKNIPFDELKLDRAFIEPGEHPEKDEIVLSTVISLFKSMGITIVQEGVETEEMLEKVAKYGCDVIQGYYYAKAISLEEFKVFLKTNTSITYKSKVK